MNDQQMQHLLPSFRIFLCGGFRAERLVGTTYEPVRTAEWGGSNYPRILLKALVCCPGRQARRETLLDMLWPEGDQAIQNLNAATTKLRKTLQWGKGQNSLLVTEADSTQYRLEGQATLWVDVDAAFTLLKEAERLGRKSPKALPLLEESGTLFQPGAFLQDEEGQWVAGRRATVEQTRYRCRLWLAEAYEHQSMPGQAESVLSQILEEDPTDEDVLCRLMTLLHRQGMGHQAIRVYDRVVEACTRDGLDLTEATKTLAIQLREDRRTSLRVYASSEERSEPISSFFHQELLAHPISEPQPDLPALLQGNGVFFPSENLGRDIFTTSLTHQSPSLIEPLERLGHALERPTQLDDTALLALETLVKDCWRFRPDIVGMISPHMLQLVLGHLRHVTVFLSGSLLASTRIRLCALASELTQIAGWTLYEMRAFSQAQAYYEMAITAAREAKNPVLEAVALARMSRLFKYCAQEEALLPTLHHARRLLQNQQGSPVYSWLCAEEALAYARDERTYESLKTLEQVTQTFQSEDQEDDPYWVGFEENVKAGFVGSCYMALHQFEQAETSYREALTQIRQSSRINPNHRRSLLSVNLATVLLQQEAVDEACQLATEALLLINQSKSPLVLQHLVKFRRKLKPWKSQTAVERFDKAFGNVHTSLIQKSEG